MQRSFEPARNSVMFTHNYTILTLTCTNLTSNINIGVFNCMMISNQVVWTLTCNVSQEHCFRLQNSEKKTLMISSQVVWTPTCNVSQEHCFRLQNSENKTLHSYQTLLPIYQTARWHNPEYYDMNLHCLIPCNWPSWGFRVIISKCKHKPEI
jgi:hypothetical protein